jgi:hypothetical protein
VVVVVDVVVVVLVDVVETVVDTLVAVEENAVAFEEVLWLEPGSRVESDTFTAALLELLLMVGVDRAAGCGEVELFEDSLELAAKEEVVPDCKGDERDED